MMAAQVAARTSSQCQSVPGITAQGRNTRIQERGDKETRVRLAQRATIGGYQPDEASCGSDVGALAARRDPTGQNEKFGREERDGKKSRAPGQVGT